MPTSIYKAYMSLNSGIHSSILRTIKILANFFSHFIESDAFRTTDVTLPVVIWPRAEYKQTPSSTSFKKGISRFVVITEAIDRKENEGALFLYQHLHDPLLLWGDKR